MGSVVSGSWVIEAMRSRFRGGLVSWRVGSGFGKIFIGLVHVTDIGGLLHCLADDFSTSNALGVNMTAAPGTRMASPPFLTSGIALPVGVLVLKATTGDGYRNPVLGGAPI